jgi:hypothetical protein
MNTADEKTDLDLIAAFIDGRLAPVERERTLQLLARDEAAFDIFADAVRVQGSEADTKVIPIDTRRSLGSLKPWTVLVPAAAAAAAVLLIAVLPRLRPGGGSIAGAPNAAVIVAQLEQQPSGLRMVAGPGWEQRDWSVTRGGTSSLAESARDFRLGVREVDLQVAVAMDARQLADRLVAEMMGWIAAIQFSEPVASRYTDVRARLAGNEPRDRLVAEASDAEAGLGQLLNSFWFVLGKWCVGAELAARGRQGAFFQSQLTAGVIKDALEGGRAKLDAEDAATLRQAAALARPGVADEDFDRVRERLRALIKRHGG